MDTLILPPADKRHADWIARLPVAAWQKDLQLHYTSASAAWCYMLGLESPEALYGRSDAHLLPLWVAQNLLRDDLALLAGHGATSDVTLHLADGMQRHIRCHRQLVLDEKGLPVGLQGFMLDITRERQLDTQLKVQEQRQNSWLRALQDHALISTMDRKGRFTYISASLARLVGQLPDQLLGQRRPASWLPPEMDLRYYLSLAEQGCPASFEFSGVHPHGTRYHLRSLIVALHKPSEQEQVFFEMLTDLSQEKAVSAALGQANDQLLRVLQDNTDLIAQLEVSARTDPLTGLLNRRAFFERAQEEQDRSERRGTPLAAIMLDIDHFKRINDNFGHDIGDQALVGLANLLREQLRSIDLLARLGGEEFVLLFPDTDLVTASRIAERLRVTVSQQVFGRGSNKPFSFTISQGVAMRRPEEAISDTLIRADQGLYEAKASGRNQVCLASSTADA
ncbi:GGDEF domain-containing protein [Chitinilyticum aquatile]|uniref:GGDEF domain-containing protein n=1 Tax=Chitinilyticum aquatile TaxID=362520 RepID=UPI0004188C1E|nr:sensor domain-containing diguanylate cyclase [Chitinilyticum aquatile]